MCKTAKKITIILIMMVGMSPTKAQNSLSDIVKNCLLVADSKEYYAEPKILYRIEDGEKKEVPLYRLKSIYDLDVISYYKIKGFDTNLQKELYKETDEYRELVKKLSAVRDSVKGLSYYYIHELKSNYDLNKAAFLYEIEQYEGNYTNIPGYISHGDFCFEYATKRFPNNKIYISVRQSYVGDKFYNQRIYLPVKDKQTALKIELAGKNKAVLFVFKINTIKMVQGIFFKKERALTRAEGIYIINSETGEVYCKIL